ncbi:MAG: ion transporter [Coriobacteriia bacterium]|nr:ion transporter [Coriobacteriia bacterium]MCL2749883.1 ion transporter [Coriobacteriia bacterium]
MRDKATFFVESKRFERFILVVILVNAVVLGVETIPGLDPQVIQGLEIANLVFIAIFVVEALIKIFALRHKYFRSGWNLFDFAIVITCLIPSGGIFSGLRVLRVFRVLRVLRLISAFGPLRKIVSSILRSLPAISWTLLLMFIVFYVFAIMGVHLFGPELPEKFATLGAAFATLFELTTLSNWQNVVFPLTEQSPWAWVYFLTFMLSASFILINVILGIVVDSLDLQNKADEKELIEASLNPDSSTKDLLRSEILKLKAQVEQLSLLVEHSEEIA